MEGYLSRQEVISCIVGALKPLGFVNALWEGGATAFNRVDEWSDIDMVVDVEDTYIEKVFEELEGALSYISPIEEKFEVPQPTWHGFYQCFYKLEKASRYLIIDFSIVKHSNPNKFLESEIHGNAKVHFDKIGVTAVNPIDRQAFSLKLQNRLEDIKKRFSMFQFLIEKELNRGNFIEAIAFYNGFTLELLVEALRIKYKPFHFNFRSRYIYYDLPKEVVGDLHSLYFVNDGPQLSEKHKFAVDWFWRTIEEIEKQNSIL